MSSKERRMELWAVRKGREGVVDRTYCIQPKNNDVIVVDDYLCPIVLTVA